MPSKVKNVKSELHRIAYFFKLKKLTSRMTYKQISKKSDLPVDKLTRIFRGQQAIDINDIDALIIAFDVKSLSITEKDGFPVEYFALPPDIQASIKQLIKDIAINQSTKKP